jgi:coenzyme F420-reducing hydrogenase alpha subunit
MNVRSIFRPWVVSVDGEERLADAWVVPGGVDAPLAAETRDQLLAALPEASAATERALGWYKASVQRFAEEAARFGDFPSAFMGLVGPDGAVEHYDGALRVVGADGVVLAERPDPRPFRCYDPCLSCSTHAIGQMPLHLQLLGPDGAVLDERRR